MRPSKIPAIVGWILSILVVAMLSGPSAMSKLTEWEGKAAAFEKLGFTVDVMYKIGVVEIAIALLFLIPRTAFVAAILIAGYLGGAICAHVRVGEAFVPPVVIGIVTWVALGLRTPGLFRLAFGGSAPTAPAN